MRNYCSSWVGGLSYLAIRVDHSSLLLGLLEHVGQAALATVLPKIFQWMTDSAKIKLIYIFARLSPLEGIMLPKKISYGNPFVY